jgi:hypothetical protein
MQRGNGWKRRFPPVCPKRNDVERSTNDFTRRLQQTFFRINGEDAALKSDWQIPAGTGHACLNIESRFVSPPGSGLNTSSNQTGLAHTIQRRFGVPAVHFF